MKTLQINHHQIPLELRRSKRAKRLILKIQPDNPRVVLVVPLFTFRFQINYFLRQNQAWIEKNWLKLKAKLAQRPALEHSPAYYKAKAKTLIRQRLVHFNKHYQFKYNRVFFRNQKTRWGSCSSQRNLNFNWRLVLAPLDILDYVVVHELCHLKEMNHSQHFWNLVAQQIPNHKTKRKWLKDNQHLLDLNESSNVSRNIVTPQFEAI